MFRMGCGESKAQNEAADACVPPANRSAEPSSSSLVAHHPSDVQAADAFKHRAPQERLKAAEEAIPDFKANDDDDDDDVNNYLADTTESQL